MIKHKFVSGKSDGGDTSVVRPSNWNADHDVSGSDFPQSAITDLVADLALKAPSSGIAQAAVTDLVSALAARSLTTHHHGELYRGFPAAGRNIWVCSPVTGTPLTTGIPALGTLQATPLIISRACTIDRIAVNVTTLVAGGKITIGLYTNTANDMYPDARLAYGEVLTDTAGVKEVVVSLNLEPGLYWLVYVGNTATTLIVRSYAVASMIPVLWFGSTLPVTPQLGWSHARAYDSTLPVAFPTASPALIVAVPIATVFARMSA